MDLELYNRYRTSHQINLEMIYKLLSQHYWKCSMIISNHVLLLLLVWLWIYSHDDCKCIYHRHSSMNRWSTISIRSSVKIVWIRHLFVFRPFCVRLFTLGMFVFALHIWKFTINFDSEFPLATLIPQSIWWYWCFTFEYRLWFVFWYLAYSIGVILLPLHTWFTFYAEQPVNVIIFRCRSMYIVHNSVTTSVLFCNSFHWMCVDSIAKPALSCLLMIIYYYMHRNT